VDDNLHARDCIARLAQNQGWQVDSCSSAAAANVLIAARQQLAQPPFDVLLLDWSVDAMDTIVAGPDTPIIQMVTAHGRAQIAQGPGQGQIAASAFLTKPLTASMLSDALREAAEQRHPSAAAALANAVPERRAGGRRLAGMRLLLVEDNPINQQVAQELLSTEGALIEVAGNGQLGVEAVARAKPLYDAVLMDLQLPVMDGYTAAVTIRHELGMHSLPIIAMTANAMSSDREACLAAGMNDHIGKPFDIHNLVQMLLRHTGFVASAAQTTAPHVATNSTPVPPPSADSEQLLNWQHAVQMLGGNLPLYQNIVRSYLTEIEALPELQRNWLAASDLEPALRSLHTIKGLSLTVGANALGALCRQHEARFKALHKDGQTLAADDGAATVDALSQMVRLTREAVVAQLEIWQPLHDACAPAAPPADAPPLNVVAMLRDIRALRVFLLNGDLAAIDAHSRLRHDHTGASDQLNQLQRAMDAFDFPEAVVQCDELIRAFGTNK